MADIGEKQKELLMNLDEEMGWNSGLNECPGVDAAAMTEIPEYIGKILEEELAAYIDDKNNYVVEGAYLICDQMSKKPVKMYHWDGKLGIEGEGGSAEIAYTAPESGVSLPCFEVDPNATEIGRFYATNSKQTANGLRYGVVSDRSCLRDEIEIHNRTVAKGVGNLVSMGNCMIMKASDVMEIKKREGKAKIYGTCYCLMKPDFRWENPYCIEDLIGNCDSHSASRDFIPISGIDATLDKPRCVQTSHHKTMEWTTKGVPEEGLTRLSTLLCARGGVITVKWSGQIIKSVEDEKSVDNKELVEDEQTVGFQFTLQQVRDCGWNISVEDLNELNRLMKEYEVTSKVSAYMMLATMLSESGNCTKTTEDYDDSSKYKYEERGAGYMQLTWKKNQRKFLSDVGESYDDIKDDVPTYIGENYAIESAVWYWTNMDLTIERNLNAYVAKNADEERMNGIFIITQYYVNSFPSGHNNTLQKIREGADYKITTKSDNDGKEIYMLEADGDSFPMPVNWPDRNNKWNTAKAVMNEE